MTNELRADSDVVGEVHPVLVIVWSEWFFAWLGIIAAGGVFGSISVAEGLEIIGTMVGFITGAIIASVFSTPIICTFALVTWAFWLLRFSPIVAGAAGASTGAIATSVTWDSVLNLDYSSSMILAGILGGIGGFLAAAWRRKQLAKSMLEEDRVKAVWRYSLRDLFWRFTVVAVLISMWSLVIARITGRIPN